MTPERLAELRNYYTVEWDYTPLKEVFAHIDQQAAEIARLKQIIDDDNDTWDGHKRDLAEAKDEIARLKKLSCCPNCMGTGIEKYRDGHTQADARDGTYYRCLTCKKEHQTEIARLREENRDLLETVKSARRHRDEQFTRLTTIIAAAKELVAEELSYLSNFHEREEPFGSFRKDMLKLARTLSATTDATDGK